MAGTSGSVSASAPGAEYEVLRDDAGAFLRRYGSDGTTADTGLDGVIPYVPAGTVVRCAQSAPAANPQIVSTVQVHAEGAAIVELLGNQVLGVGGAASGVTVHAIATQ